MFLYSLASYLLVIPVTAHLFLPLFYNSGAMTVFEVCSLQGPSQVLSPPSSRYAYRKIKTYDEPFLTSIFPQYLELRFDRFLRYVTVSFYFLQMMIYVAIQLYAPALALSNGEMKKRPKKTNDDS